MPTATDSTVPVPAGATEVTEWADRGHPDEFRSFDGPKWTVPNLFFKSGTADMLSVFVYGTQLRDGTVEGRSICVDGLNGADNMLNSANARALANALLAAADTLDQLGGTGTLR